MQFYKKKVFVFSLLLIFTISVSVILCFAFNKEKTSYKKYNLKFGATYMTMNNPFYEIIDNEIRSDVEAKGDTLITRDPALSVDKQIEQIENFISMHVRAIFLNPVDLKKLHSVITEAKHAGIPVIVVDSPVINKNDASCTVVSDNYNAGVLCAKHLMATRKSANIMILEHKEAQSAVDRIRGFEDTVKGHSEYKIVARGDSIGQLENAMPVTEKLLKKAPETNIIMALNDPSALGAIAALKSHNMLSKVLVYGVDGSPEAKTMIKDGNMTATAAQFPTQIGKTATEQMYNIINGKTHKSLCIIPVELISSQNIDKCDVDNWQ